MICLRYWSVRKILNNVEANIFVYFFIFLFVDGDKITLSKQQGVHSRKYISFEVNEKNEMRSLLVKKNQIRLKEIESFFAAFRMHNNTIHEEKCVAFCHLEKWRKKVIFIIISLKSLCGKGRLCYMGLTNFTWISWIIFRLSFLVYQVWLM